MLEIYIGNVEKLSKIYSVASNYKLVIINGGLELKDQNVTNNVYYNSCEKYYKVNSTILTHIEFSNSTKISIINGGISKEMIINKKINYIESLFVKYIDNEIWHKKYTDDFGYMISNFPLSDNPNFYRHSTQIGCNKLIYGQEVDQYGLQDTILI